MLFNLFSPQTATQRSEYTCFRPGQFWLDTEGSPIQAHGGCLIHSDDTYYWYGENKNGKTLRGRVDFIGINCYSSKDLMNWKNEGLVLRAVPDFPKHDLHPSKVVERPRVLYNKKTNKYVMWMHVDNADYSYAKVGIAIAQSPAGPFEYMGSMRPCGADSRDMTLYKDDDTNVAYLICSTEGNRNLTIAKLTDDYLNVSDEFTKCMIHSKKNAGREAASVFKYRGSYYMITSGCSGWNPNSAMLHVATDMLGPWCDMGNPCVGQGADKTFNAQSTWIMPVPGKKDSFIFMADRWNSSNLRDSRYVWLPIILESDEMAIQWRESWDLSFFNKRDGMEVAEEEEKRNEEENPCSSC